MFDRVLNPSLKKLWKKLWKKLVVFCRVWWGESRREEVATRGVLKISQNTRENTCARVSFSIQLLAEATIKLLWKVAVVNLKIKYLQIYINFWLKISSGQVIPKLFSNILRAASLTHFILLLSFYTSWKHQKIIGFLTFSQGKESDVHEIG